MPDQSLMVCFVAVAEELSFTRAGVKLGLTQPQVSLRIRKLEVQLGFSLFSRTTRQVLLTAEAQDFLPYAAEVVRAWRDAEAYLTRLENSRARLLRLGSPEVTLKSPVRSRLLNGFIDRYSTIRLEISIGVTPDLMERLRSGEIDALLNFHFIPGGRSQPTPGWQHLIPLQRSVARLAAPLDHPLSKLPRLRAEHLAGHEMALSPGTECPAIIDQIQTYLQRLSVRCRRAPETHRATLSHFARAHRLPCFEWAVEGEPYAETLEGVGLIPFADREFMHELCLVTRSADDSLPTRSIRNLALEVAEVPSARTAA